jgi:hypothetical protein
LIVVAIASFDDLGGDQGSSVEWALWLPLTLCQRFGHERISRRVAQCHLVRPGRVFLVVMGIAREQRTQVRCDQDREGVILISRLDCGGVWGKAG